MYYVTIASILIQSTLKPYVEHGIWLGSKDLPRWKVEYQQELWFKLMSLRKKVEVCKFLQINK